MASEINNPMRGDTPGLPSYYTGVGHRDPRPITEFNVGDVLVGWMNLEQIAAAMFITTPQAKRILAEFLSTTYARREEKGVMQWSKFTGRTLGTI